MKTLYIGAGHAGSTIVEYFSREKKSPDVKTIQFLTSITDDNNYASSIILADNGSGKSIIEARELYIEDKSVYKKIVSTIEDNLSPKTERVVIVYASGGSGSALGPEIASIVRKKANQNCQIVIVPIFPFKKDGPSCSSNAIIAWDKLYYSLGQPNDNNRITIIPISNEYISSRLIEERIASERIREGKELSQEEIQEKLDNFVFSDLDVVNTKSWGVLDVMNTIIRFDEFYINSKIKTKITVDAKEYEGVVYGRMTKRNIKTGSGVIGYMIRDFHSFKDLDKFISDKRFPQLDIGEPSSTLEGLVSIAIPSFSDIKDVKDAEKRVEKITDKLYTKSKFRNIKMMSGVNYNFREKTYKQDALNPNPIRLIMIFSGASINKLQKENDREVTKFSNKREKYSQKSQAQEQLPEDKIKQYDI